MATNLLMFTSSYVGRRFAASQWRIYVKWRPWQNVNVRPF